MQLTFGAIEPVFLTLSEMASLPDPVFLFVFTRRVPGDEFAVILTPTESTERYDRFDIDVSEVFADRDLGQWSYRVYEQESEDNTNPENAGAELERGMVHLIAETSFAFLQRDTTTTFIQPK